MNLVNTAKKEVFNFVFSWMLLNDFLAVQMTSRMSFFVCSHTKTTMNIWKKLFLKALHPYISKMRVSGGHEIF
jgi:hypothetical protein